MVWVAATPQSAQGVIRRSVGRFTHSTNSANSSTQAEQVQRLSGLMHEGTI